MSLKSAFEKPIIIVLILSLVVPIARFVFAAAPNPGHTWSEIGDIAVTVAQGGTGLSTIAAGGILYASALDTLTRIAPSGANQVLRSTAANALEFAALVATDIPNLDMSKITTGTLGVSQGGTGLTTLTANNVLIGNGTGTPSFVAPGANGNVLTSNGTTWTSTAPTGGSTNALLDGTNHTDTLAGTVVRGDVIVGNSTPKWSRLAKGTANQVLSMNSAATDVAWADRMGYTLDVQALTSSPADAATVYFGQIPRAPSTVGLSKVYIREPGIIKAANILAQSGTAGTAEAWSLYIRVNNTTDTLIATVSAATAERVWSNSALSITVNAGDYFEIKSVQPTWATNPLTTIYGGYVYIE